MQVTFLISLAKPVRREHMLLSNLKNKAVIPQRHKIENTQEICKVERSPDRRHVVSLKHTSFSQQ